MAPKFGIAILHVNIALKTLHLIETAKHIGEKRIPVLATYKTYTQATEKHFISFRDFGVAMVTTS